MADSDDTKIPDDVLPYDDEDDEGDGDSSSGGGKGGGWLPKAKSQEGLLHKIADLILHPFSHLVPGASAMASENELSQRIFMGKIGLANNEITREDLADPHLIKRLDARQSERRERFGIPHPDRNFQILPAEDDGSGESSSSASMVIDSSLIGGSGEKQAEGQDKARRAEGKDKSRDRDADDMSLDDDGGWEDDAYGLFEAVLYPALPMPSEAGDLSNLFAAVGNRTAQQEGFKIRLQQNLDLGERHDVAPSPRGVS
jgi:hypothetical protein